MSVDPHSELTAHRVALWQSLLASELGDAWDRKAEGCLGVLVSAGPSLSRNGAALADERWATRRLVVATIDSMGPLKRLGVHPDVVVACERPRTLDAESAVESGAAIVAWGEAAEDAALPGRAWRVPGSAGDGDETFAAHLLLRHLGCGTVVLAGVDLAFVDGIAHAPGHALDRAWALESHPFRSWDWLHARRIAMRKGGLFREPDRGGRTVLVDAMLRRERAALEAAFDEDRRAGRVVIDATEGGCTKRHTDQMSLAEALQRHATRRVPDLPPAPERRSSVARPQADVRVNREEVRAIAVVPVDPDRGGTGVERSLASALGDRTVMRRTLERLLHARELAQVVLAVPEGWDPAAALDGLPVEGRLVLARRGPAPDSIQRRSRWSSRAWCDACWRGGLGGRSVFDEILDTTAVGQAMEMARASHAFLCGPDWPLVAVREAWGADGMVAAARQSARRQWMHFAPGPAGASGCLLSRDAVGELASGQVPSIGAWLESRVDWSRQPERMRPPTAIATLRERLIMDTPRAILRIRRSIEPLLLRHADPDQETIVAAVSRLADAAPSLPPQQLILELNTGRRGCGASSPHRFGSLQRPPMTLRRLDRLTSRLAEARDTVVTLGGAGDPLIHPDVGEMVRRLRAAGALAIELRTELLSPTAAQRVRELDVELISVDLHAVDAPGYRVMMGPGDFGVACAALHDLLVSRQGPRNDPFPWILPRVERLRPAVAWVPMFVEQWTRDGDGAIVDSPPQTDPWGSLMVHAPMPATGDDPWAHPDTLRRMTVLSDGRVPVVDGDLLGSQVAGSVDSEDLVALYRTLVSRRRDRSGRAALSLARMA